MIRSALQHSINCVSNFNPAVFNYIVQTFEVLGSLTQQTCVQYHRVTRIIHFTCSSLTVKRFVKNYMLRCQLSSMEMLTLLAFNCIKFTKELVGCKVSINSTI